MENKKDKDIAFFALMAGVTIIFLYLLKPLFFPIFWAAVIAGITRPLYFRINNSIKHPALSLTLFFVFLMLVVMIPLTVLGVMIFDESRDLYQLVKPGEKGLNPSLQRIIDALTDNDFARLALVNKELLISKATEAIRSLANYLLVHIKNITQNTLGLIVQFGIMLYTLFYFIRDGGKLVSMTGKILPLDEEKQRFLFEKFIAAARSTLKATLVIGGIQGGLGAIAFWIAGVKGAFIWGSVMILMSIIPVVGSAIIWIPAGIIMLVMGYIWEGILILAVGTFVISTVDNLLRPVLVGRDVEMHPLLIFLSTIGGIILFGFSGFVIGPVVTALLIAFWEMHERFYQKE
jgi:predicted PurR-regulated permease PerM